MVKHEVGFDDAIAIYVPPKVIGPLIAKLKSKGIDQIGGIPVEDIIYDAALGPQSGDAGERLREGRKQYEKYINSSGSPANFPTYAAMSETAGGIQDDGKFRYGYEQYPTFPRARSEVLAIDKKTGDLLVAKKNNSEFFIGFEVVYKNNTARGLPSSSPIDADNEMIANSLESPDFIRLGTYGVRGEDPNGTSYTTDKNKIESIFEDLQNKKITPVEAYQALMSMYLSNLNTLIKEDLVAILFRLESRQTDYARYKDFVYLSDYAAEAGHGWTSVVPKRQNDEGGESSAKNFKNPSGSNNLPL